MTEESKIAKIEEFYGAIKGYQYKPNAEILYNIIHAKSRFELQDCHQSLYLDIKQFLTNYMMAASKADYGYDDIRLDKILNVAKCLDDVKQQKAILCIARRHMLVRGYEVDDISEEINRMDIKIAYEESKWFKLFSLVLSSNLWMLLASYLCYVITLSLVLLPAPFEWMGIFSSDMITYCDIGFLNHLANTLMLLCGSDDNMPKMTPNCLAGVVVYCLGVILFYFFFVNFIFKKLEDYLTIK